MVQHGSTNYNFHVRSVIEGSLDVKLPTIWTDGKAKVRRVREEKSQRRKIREEKTSSEKIREKKE